MSSRGPWFKCILPNVTHILLVSIPQKAHLWPTLTLQITWVFSPFNTLLNYFSSSPTWQKRALSEHHNMTLIVFSLRPSFRANPMLCATFDNTAAECRPAADMFCIDRACLPSLTVLYRVSAAESAKRRNVAGKGGSSQWESSCLARQKDTFHNEYILLLIPNFEWAHWFDWTAIISWSSTRLMWSG